MTHGGVDEEDAAVQRPLAIDVGEVVEEVEARGGCRPVNRKRPISTADLTQCAGEGGGGGIGGRGAPVVVELGPVDL